MPKKTLAPLPNKLTSSRGPILQAGHDVDEEAEVVSVVVLVWMRSALIADGAQGGISSESEAREHRGVLVLQRFAAIRFARHPLRYKLASPRSPSLQASHDVGEEVEVAGVVILVRMRIALVTDGAPGAVGSGLEILEHRAMLALERQAMIRFVRSPFRKGCGVLDLPLKGG